jgi:AWS domain
MDHERKRRKKRPAVWQLVRENIYTHRRRKQQDEDDIMICQCRRPQDGGVGCGADCLNRLLNIECVPVSAGQYVDDVLSGADCARGCLPGARLATHTIYTLQGYCPCEETCSNQMFSKRQYAQLDKVSSQPDITCYWTPKPHDSTTKADVFVAWFHSGELVQRGLGCSRRKTCTRDSSSSSTWAR